MTEIQQNNAYNMFMILVKFFSQQVGWRYKFYISELLINFPFPENKMNLNSLTSV